MIDVCMALAQPVFSAHWCAVYSKYRGFLAGGSSIASSPLPFSDHGSAAKTLIAHRDNTASYAGYVVSGGYSILFLPYTSLDCCYFDKINIWISKFKNHDLKFSLNF